MNIELQSLKEFWTLTCVLLRGHGRVHDLVEEFHPLLLVALHLAGEHEVAVGRLYGDAVLPGAVAVGAGGEAGRHVVAMVPAAQEDLAFGESVLAGRRENDQIKWPVLQQHASIVFVNS